MYIFIKFYTRKKPPHGGGLVLDDIACRLNVNSNTRVYSVSLPANIKYTSDPAPVKWVLT